MADKARGVHVSPGIYTKETELTYAVKSLGITTLGVAGETLKGPAFQPMLIENWRQFQDVFGGTSPEKFKGSKYPKYELPYVAKSYLKESKQLQVCRVLGLGGYNAGPAWVITASGNSGSTKTVVAVLRSRGYYEPYAKWVKKNDDCACPTSYDSLFYYVGEKKNSESGCEGPKTYEKDALKLAEYTSFDYTENKCNVEGKVTSGNSKGYDIGVGNYGRFTISGYTDADSGNTFSYPVSLNPGDKDYILNVLGTDAQKGDAPIFVESLYDVALQQGIESGKLKKIDSALTFYNVYYAADFCDLEPVYGMLEAPSASLERKDVGKRFLCADSAKTSNSGVYYTYTVDSGGTTDFSDNGKKSLTLGNIYTVSSYTDEKGRHYYYAENKGDNLIKPNSNSGQTSGLTQTLVKNNADGFYYRFDESGKTVSAVTTDLNDYKSAYRFASTPWIVSNLKGDFKNIEVNKLFRFHTISDGNSSNYEVKISIENIRPDDGLFDVVVRNINDSDESISVLEKFSQCSLTPGDKRYIAYKIGSYDGFYESKSKYITVEVNENDTTRLSVPAGFMGYPIHKFDGLPISGKTITGVTFPDLKYNRHYDSSIKNRKQYFGLSSWVGVDIDTFTFKGNAAYVDDPKFVTHGFHLDSRLDKSNYASDSPTITVDGVSGYTFDAVSASESTNLLNQPPVIGTESEMYGSIYENVNLRKFTVYFYGGFDGWDIYRDSRSNTDDFKMSQYKSNYNPKSGEGYAFSKIYDPEVIGLNQAGITSDWYAYLAAYRQFANPESVDINVFATPGIDYVNNKLLVDEVIEMIEEERADSIYVVTTPDKPFGSGDYVDEMFTPSDAVDNLEDTEIDSNYTCTYYPWVKYLDTDNNQYIMLPPTKDVVRNIALTDNTTQSWYAPAGLERGNVECERVHIVTKLADEDVLYEGRINPVKTFASDGPHIWGQKTLSMNEDSLLNRINVRRLMLRLRKMISIGCLNLIFMPNDPSTKNSFLSIVTPILDNVRSERGITDYRIEVDENVEGNDCKELNCKIFVKPICALEYINIEFVITPQGLEFTNI